jgi:hypothetical protein
MLNFVIIAVPLTVMYIFLFSLMKAAGKKTPVIPDTKQNIDEDNQKE